MKNRKIIAHLPPIKSIILTIRNQKVILDSDLARIYGVSTKRLNEQVKRNAKRFPPDFAFHLKMKEVQNLKSQIATSSGKDRGNQIETSSTHGGRRKLPVAFNEHGALMAANVLKSLRAVKMNVFVGREFINL